MSAVFPPPTIKVFTVGELTRAIKGLLEDAYTPVWVEGEVSNLARPSSGHLYLTLKDEDAPLKAVIYRGVALRCSFDLNDGMRVIVPRPAHRLSAARRVPTPGRGSPAQGHRPARTRLPSAQGKAVHAGLFRPRPQEEAAAHPAAHRPRHQPHRLGRARHAGDPVAALAGRRGLGLSGQGAGRRGGPRHRRRRRPAQPAARFRGRRHRRADRRPRRRQPRRPVGLQRGAGRPGDLRLAACPSSAASATKTILLSRIWWPTFAP